MGRDANKGNRALLNRGLSYQGADKQNPFPEKGNGF